MITSTANQQVKRILQLQTKPKARWQQQMFVAEGPRMVFEAPIDYIEQIYVSESFWLEEENQRELSESGLVPEILSDSVMRTVSRTQTPQGILALVYMPDYSFEQILDESGEVPLLLVLEGIQDPGNLGTIFRTGEAAGVTGILMDKTTVDLFNPKAVRATMGAVYRVPFYVADSLQEVAESLELHEIRLYAAHLQGERLYDEPDYADGTAFLLGNEGNGLTEEVAALAYESVRIPMAGQAESLNVAVAASLLAYEAARQRRG